MSAPHAIDPHPILRRLDALLTAVFGGAGVMPYLGLSLQLVCAVGAAISGFVTWQRYRWDRDDRLERRTRERAAELERANPTDARLACPATLDPAKVEKGARL